MLKGFIPEIRSIFNEILHFFQAYAAKVLNLLYF